MNKKYHRPRFIFLDQDGPLANFAVAAQIRGIDPLDAKMLPGFYRSLPLTPGAKEAVQEMHTWHDVHVFIATKIPDHNPLAATEKIQWLHEHLPELEERIIVTPNKACIGTARDFLVDDRAHKADAQYFPGTFLHFGTAPHEGWEQVMTTLRRELGRPAR